jgi:hypothetical protein
MMNVVLECKGLARQAGIIPAIGPNRRDQSGGSPRRYRFWLALLLLAGYLLFAHGCHGDEDNELLMKLRGSIADLIE